MKTEFKNIAHLYVNGFNPTKVMVDDKEIKWLWSIDVAKEGGDMYVNITCADLPNRAISPIDEGWGVYNDDESLSRIKPILRHISSLTNDECLKCYEILGGASHLSDDSRIHQAREILCTIQGFHHSVTNIKGARWMYIFTYLLSLHIDLFNLIGNNEALDAATLTPNPYENT